MRLIIELNGRDDALWYFPLEKEQYIVGSDQFNYVTVELEGKDITTAQELYLNANDDVLSYHVEKDN